MQNYLLREFRHHFLSGFFENMQVLTPNPLSTSPQRGGGLTPDPSPRGRGERRMEHGSHLSHGGEGLNNVNVNNCDKVINKIKN